jgi:DNA topoisomerase VI subunit A
MKLVKVADVEAKNGELQE